MDLAKLLNEKDFTLRSARSAFGAAPWTDSLSVSVPPWLVPGLLQREAIHVLSSDSGACKSWLGLELMLSGIYGIPVLGQHPTTRFNSIYLAVDSPRWDIGQQLRKLMVAHELRPLKDPTSFIFTHGFLLDEPDHVNMLGDFASSWDIDAFFIDVMLYVHQQNENDNGAMANHVLRSAKYLRDTLGLAVFFLHHNSKPQPGMPSTFRGAGTIIQAAEHHHTLTPRSSSIDLTIEKIRGDAQLPKVTPFRLSVRNGGRYLERLHVELTPPTSKDPVLALLAQGPASRAAIVQLLVQDEGYTEKQVDNRLQYLRGRGAIETDGRGEWRLTLLPS